MELCKKAWNDETNQWVEIFIVSMTSDHARFWHQKIQPQIRQQVEQEKIVRADYNWHWVRMRHWLPLSQQIQNRRCFAYTILLRKDSPGANGAFAPAAMLLGIESYPWLLPTISVKRSSFAWFLTSAPKDVLKEPDIGVSNAPALGRILLDTAMVTSENAGHKGRIWLHAAPAGGQALFDWYIRRGLDHVSPGTTVPPLGLRSDGRHFFADSSLAKRLMRELNVCRGS
jgi:hypothetical protein